MILVVIIIGTVSVTSVFGQTASAQQQQQQVYYVYVDPIPDFATSYASNVIHDATKAWSDANPNIVFYKADTPQQADLDIQWIKEYASATAGEYVTGT